MVEYLKTKVNLPAQQKVEIIKNVKFMQKKCNQLQERFDEIVHSIEKQNKIIVEQYTNCHLIHVPNKELVPGNLQFISNQNSAVQRKSTDSRRNRRKSETNKTD